MLGVAAQDYLKSIYKAANSGARVTPSLVAERMGVSAPAVTKMLRRLQELRLIDYARSQEIHLTPAGEKIALEVIRHHRLLEVYLLEALGYTWDQVDAEAERLEHVISEEFEDRIDALLGHPTRDPHGDPIPTKDGRIDATRHQSLAELEPGQEAVIRRVADRDAGMLRYMAGLGLYPDTHVRMLLHEPYGGPLRVRVAETEHAIGRELAGRIFVSPEVGGPDAEREPDDE